MIIKNYYNSYKVAELKEGLIALNLKFIEDKFFDKFTGDLKPQITAEEADIKRACEWLEAKKAAEEAAYEKQLDEAVELGKNYIAIQLDELQEIKIVALDDFLKGDYKNNPQLKGKVICRFEIIIDDQAIGHTNLPEDLFYNSIFYKSADNCADYWHISARTRDREIDW